MRRVALVGWLIAVAGALRLLPLARLHPIVWDEIEYFRATDWVAHGLVPYRDFWEHHTPLQWFVFAPVAALTSSAGVSAILAMRWAQVPLWIAAFVLLAKWMRRAGISVLGAALAILFALCSTRFMLGAIEYRVDALGCALFVAALYLRGYARGAALCLAGFANIRLGPLIVVTVLVDAPWSAWKERARVIAGGAITFALCALYFLATGSAAIAFRRVWTENYLADRLAGEPPLAMFRRLATPFGIVAGGFDPAAVDVGTIVIFIAGLAGVFLALRREGDLRRLAILQIANVVFVASMKFIYHYHFLIIILLALPLVAHVCDLLVERGLWRPIVAVVTVTIAVSAFASLFRGKEDDLDYQDLIMREVDRRTPPGARVFDGVGYAIRRRPAYRYWFLAENVRVLEARRIFESYDIAADPPDAVIVDIPARMWLASHPQTGDFVRRHYLPTWPELWLPAMSARLTADQRLAEWIVPADGTYRVRAPVAFVLTVDGKAPPVSDTLRLRKRQRLKLAAPGLMQPTNVMILPEGETDFFRRPPAGVSLDAAAPPRTHFPRLW